MAFPNKGGRISRRNENNELVPYHDRGAIEAGALDGQRLEICWLRDPFDLLAIQLEGSGRVILEDGTPLRVSFDSHNGYPYSSIERVFIDRNLLPRNAISPQGTRDWMAAHPDEAAKARAANRSYVFFRVTGLTNEGEPVGAQGVPLTPGRSIAVDRVHGYGTPFFIEADLPIEGRKLASPFRRLMIAQDTGSAIVGPARADLYWGAGDEAGRIAGRIRHPGRFVMLLPRELDIAAAGRESPLPKPKIAALEVKKQDDKGKANSANAGASATGRQKPSPPPNTKIGARSREAGRQRQGKLRDRRHERDRQVYPLAGTEAKELGDRRQEAGRQRQSADRRRQLQRDRGRSAQAGAGAEVENRRDRSHETKRQRQNGFRQRSRDRGWRQAEVVAGADIEDPRDRGQETRCQRQSAGRQPRRGWESGGKVGPASRPHAKERPVITLLVAARSTSERLKTSNITSALPPKDGVIGRRSCGYLKDLGCCASAYAASSIRRRSAA